MQQCLDLVKVDVYGQANANKSSWKYNNTRTKNDKYSSLGSNNVPLVDAAIKKSELGLNPQIDGQLIRLPVPELNEERRTELKKLLNQWVKNVKFLLEILEEKQMKN